MIAKMLARVSTYFSRVDKFAAACYGRGKAAISLGAWFTLDGILGGGLKKIFKSYGLGWIPAASNFMVFLTYFFSQAKVTHDLHPACCDLEKEGKKFKATTEMILGQFKRYPHEAALYLQNFDTDLSLLSDQLDVVPREGGQFKASEKATEIKGSLQHYALLHKMYEELKPHRVDTCHQLGDAMVHGLSYFYEYLLLIYFEELNILNFLLSFESFSLSSLLGILVLIFASGSALQAYSFAAEPKLALDEELLKEISDSFLNFREPASEGYGSMNFYARNLLLPSQEREASSAEELELISRYATANSVRRCYLH